MEMKDKKELIDDVEIFSYQKNKVKNNPIGYEKIKPGKGKQFFKKTGESISKLALIVATTVMDVPLVKEALNSVGAMEANGIVGHITRVIGEMQNLELSNINGMLVQPDLYMNMTLPSGKYAFVGYFVQFCVNIAINHPGIIIAGGSALMGFLTSKIIYPIIKKIAIAIKKVYNNKKRYKNANSKQYLIYDCIKRILKHKNFKRPKNTKMLVKTLNDVVLDVELAANYKDDLEKLYVCLEEVYNLIDKKLITDYKQAVINIQANLKRIEAKSYEDCSREIKFSKGNVNNLGKCLKNF